MNMISDNTKSIQYSKIRKMFNKALEYENPISFTIGEPDFTASENIVAAGCRAMQEGKSKYSENAGILPLRKAVSAYLKAELGLDYNPVSEITMTPGAMAALYQGLKVILNPGDEVIVIEPCWTNYLQQILMCGGVPVSVCADMENGFSLDIEAVKAAISEKTKAVIINSPCNPTGTVLEKSVLEELAALAVTHDLLVISDEVYKHIVFDDVKFTSIAALPGMQNRTLVIDSFSKTFAMTGFRVGYAAGPAEIIANITKLQENISACVAMPSQYAAVEALTGSREHLNYMVKCYKERRDYLAGRLSTMPMVHYEPSKGTFYAFVSIKDTGLSSSEFAEKLLEDKQVVVVPGDAFGNYGEGYIRISFATSMEQITKGMDALEIFLNELAEAGENQ
ncbi:pyridoxal phosphate-dependent aminotransferase [Anaerovoracaceae bacterium 41-7]|jgi:aminotransferase|uniref:Aminotransferase n=1 Tax=Anaerotruncus colihominis TaxID=169435 RepID=A0A845QL53_9FIRM|nr:MULTISPECIES: pyridoxal phosphate-dependent aminotransferase [Clostridia]MCI9638786.1 pyridoxal phosphate-dependent aminotransferase [Emergencia sp.]NBH62579.1 pyridoxal phosphate-dependent aminotransferase [Anaerotruncus colihominis]NCE97670.1 pyridoxal phosphate-dependent aminotransferase [Emergencia sp. 1XD21-10]NCF03234.1 pyridoxal phosphate-dependent aminotransferase [Anaerotruncus sp. 80]